jgi:hypothetical protein
MKYIVIYAPEPNPGRQAKLGKPGFQEKEI